METGVARLRAVLTGGWSKKPEPRVRYGQPFLPGLAAFGRQYVAEARPLIQRAEAVRGRRFTYLGRTVGYPGRIDWNPRGLSAPWCIALNSLDELFALGVTAGLAPTAEVRRTWYEVAAALVRDWIGGARRGQGFAWGVPALARRVSNLVHFHAFFAAELRADAAMRRDLLESLYAQAEALAAASASAPFDPSLIAAGRALFMAGRFFDGMEARGWLEKGTTVLWEQLREQVHDDGGHRSRNPAMHARVLADYLEIFALLRASNDDVPIWGRKRVKGMADFLTRLRHPDGEIPLFHGAAPDLARPARELLAAAAVLLHEPSLAEAGELPGVWPFLVLGEAGRRVYANFSGLSREGGPRALRRTGYYLLPGEPDDVMLLDGDSPPVGGDANVFGYELSAGGLRLIVDAGVGDDNAPRWTEFFTSARAHNCVVVSPADGPAAAARSVRPAQVSDVHWVVRDGLVYFAATHDDFAAPGLRHRRRVFCLPGQFWLVCDEIAGAGGWEAESFLHLHPEVTLAAGRSGQPVLVASRSERARVQLVFAGQREVRIVCGTEEPAIQGWYAPRHGECLAAPVVSVVAGGTLPIVFGYAILPRASGAAELALEHDAFHLRARLRTAGREYVVSALQHEVELSARSV